MNPNENLSLQDQFAPNTICFGCGPRNQKGLQIKSFDQGEWVVAEFRPEAHHEAFPGMVNGGILGALLDCHSNWTAANALRIAHHQKAPPCTVTADFHVKLRAPTPSQCVISLRAKVQELKEDRAVIFAEAFSVSNAGERKLTATCTGTFVAVKEGHPAYHRWG
jgi:acyl-coenzyme A thioesterase PaaI-like protein